jgi:hypothetical protein
MKRKNLVEIFRKEDGIKSILISINPETRDKVRFLNLKFAMMLIINPYSKSRIEAFL